MASSLIWQIALSLTCDVVFLLTFLEKVNKNRRGSQIASLSRAFATTGTLSCD